MKRLLLFPVVALLVASCSPPVVREEVVVAVAPRPVPPKATPHPATGATQQAIKLFPDLAKADSIFNRTFRDIYAHELASNPRSLESPEWPLGLARKTALMLGVQGTDVPVEVPRTPRPQMVISTPRTLEMGAYGGKRRQPRVIVITPVPQ